MIPILTIIISILVLFVFVLDRTDKIQWQLFFLIGAVGLLVCSLVLFIGAMSAFTEAGVGSFMGQGILPVSIPGEEFIEPTLCHWGPGIGFWLYVLSGIILISSLLVVSYQKMKTR